MAPKPLVNKNKELKVMNQANKSKAIIITLITGLFLAFTTGQASAKDYFGAIAISPSTKAMGWSYDYSSKWKANNTALKKCRKYASDCRIATWFRNACGAVAVGQNGGWGAQWGHNIKNAKWKARKTCRKYDSNCKVKRWVCTKH